MSHITFSWFAFCFSLLMSAEAGSTWGKVIRWKDSWSRSQVMLSLMHIQQTQVGDHKRCVITACMLEKRKKGAERWKKRVAYMRQEWEEVKFGEGSYGWVPLTHWLVYARTFGCPPSIPIYSLTFIRSLPTPSFLPFRFIREYRIQKKIGYCFTIFFSSYKRNMWFFGSFVTIVIISFATIRIQARPQQIKSGKGLYLFPPKEASSRLISLIPGNGEMIISLLSGRLTP